MSRTRPTPIRACPATGAARAASASRAAVQRVVVDVLADEAELARLEWEWMNEAVARSSAESVPKDRRGLPIAAGELAAMPGALARLLLRRPMSCGGRRPGHRPRPCRAGHGPGDRHGGPAFDAPGQRVERIGADVVLTIRPADTPRGRLARPQPRANLFRYSLSIPGEVVVAEAGVVVSAETARHRPAGGCIRGQSGRRRVEPASCPGPLVVRNRRPGDRFRPLGLGGQKKLQDFFVDRKVAREARDRCRSWRRKRTRSCGWPATPSTTRFG